MINKPLRFTQIVLTALKGPGVTAGGVLETRDVLFALDDTGRVWRISTVDLFDGIGAWSRANEDYELTLDEMTTESRIEKVNLLVRRKLGSNTGWSRVSTNGPFSVVRDGRYVFHNLDFDDLIKALEALPDFDEERLSMAEQFQKSIGVLREAAGMIEEADLLLRKRGKAPPT